MGRRSKSNANRLSIYRLIWDDIKYEPGTIKVVAYDASGKAVAEEKLETAGKPHHIELSADRSVIAADGKDLSFITARVVDAKGNLCPADASLLRFKVSGEGHFKAVANGDATSLEAFHLPQMHVFNGMLVAIVQADEKPGQLVLQATADGLKSGKITISTQ
jgi:beta-galactosidase